MNDMARLVEWADGAVLGNPGRRLMVVLAAPGCAYARGPRGGCTNCSFPTSFGTGGPVSKEQYAAQLEGALASIPRRLGQPVLLDLYGAGAELASGLPVELSLYCSGSFFNPEEIPWDAQQALLTRASSEESIELVLVESRPEYVTAEAVRSAGECLGSTALEVAIGLESANPAIREDRIRKGFTWEQFEDAARTLAATGARLLVYVLLKPMRTGEAEAVADAIATARKVFALGEELDLPVRIALEPCFVGPGTPLFEEHRRGRYRPPWLWSVIEVLKRITDHGPVLVGLSDEGLSPRETAHNCYGCTNRVRERLETFNRTQSLLPLLKENCDCRREWKRLFETVADVRTADLGGLRQP